MYTFFDGFIDRQHDIDEKPHQIQHFQYGEESVNHSSGHAKRGKGGRHIQICGKDGVVYCVWCVLLALAMKQRLRISSETKQSKMISRGDERYNLYLRKVRMRMPWRGRMRGEPIKNAYRSMSRSSTMFLHDTCATTGKPGFAAGTSHHRSSCSWPRENHRILRVPVLGRRSQRVAVLFGKGKLSSILIINPTNPP